MGNIMKFTKSLALTLSVVAGLGTSNAIAGTGKDYHMHKEVHQIKVEIDGEQGAHLFIDANGKKIEKMIPLDTFNDKEKLAEALSDLPEAEREKLLASLGNLSSELHMVKHRHVEGEESSTYFTESGEKVVVIDINSEELGDDVTKVVKEFIHHDGEKIVKIKRGGSSTGALLHMIKSGEFSKEELTQLQQALDEKH